MQTEDFDKQQPTINFAKVVSVPTLFSWSQAYNAGRLFAVLSLGKNKTQEDADSLNILGKDLLSKLEEEFFTLDSKNQTTIKQAILSTFKNVDGEITYSFACSFFADKKLYIFIIGTAAAFLKREPKIAKFVLVKKDQKSVTSYVGNTENNDLIALTTDYRNNFFNTDAFLEERTVFEIADLLTPVVLEKEDGKISLVILKYSKHKSLLDNQDSLLKQIETKEEDGRPQEKRNLFATIVNLKKYMPSLSHSKKVFLTLAVIVFMIFTSSVYFAVTKQESAKTLRLFEETYKEAEEKYLEGNSLLGLNKNVARENFVQAKKILEQAKPKFSKNSKEEKQIVDLLQKVKKAIAASSGVNLVDARKIDLKESIFLSLQITQGQAQFSQDQANVYFVDSDAVHSVPKENGKKDAIIKNSNFWQTPSSLGVFLGNIYILDKGQKQILKFAPIEDGFGKSNYLAKVLPDFSKASSMAIDGSIFVLSNDGVIQKFTRGSPEQFTISGLDAPFISPSKIFTDRNTSNIYILDNGNSRIVVVNKEGIYQSQYSAGILKNAQALEVLEKDKKILVLSQKKMYEIELK